MNIQRSFAHGTAMPAYILMRELTGTVPVFGGEKVRIGFFGDGAFVNFKQKYVNLPALPPSKMIPGRIVQEIRGFGMHESAHLLFTDNDFMENGRTDEEKQDVLLHETWNAIEDYFIDRNFMSVYPGYHKNLTATFARTAAQYLANTYAKNPDVAKDLRVIGPVALTWFRAVYFGLTTQAPRDALATLPQALYDRVQEHFWATELVASTQDCFEHAKVIAEDFRTNPHDPQNMPLNPQSLQGQGQGAQGQGGQGQAGQGPGGQGSGSGQSGSYSDSLGPGAKGGSAPTKVDAQGRPEPQPISTSRNIDDALRELGDLSDAQTREISITSWSTSDEGRASDLISAHGGHASYNEVRSTVSGTVGTVARVLRRDLQTVTQRRWRTSLSDGALDTKILHRAYVGSNELYKRRTQNRSIDTALTILVDCSGSMGGLPINICQEMSIALEAALVNTPVKLEIIGFRSTSDHDVPDSLKQMIDSLEAQGEQYHREDVEMLVFKSFSDGRTKATLGLGNMHHAAGGGTPTGEAIMMAGARLLKRKEGRHVMLVLTDGAPNDNKKCKEAVDSLEKCGVTVFGFGIASDAVKHAFARHTIISEIRELGSIVMGTLSRELIGSASMKPRNILRLPAHIYTE